MLLESLHQFFQIIFFSCTVGYNLPLLKYRQYEWNKHRRLRIKIYTGLLEACCSSSIIVLLLRSDFFFAKGFDLNGSVVFWWWNDDMLKHLIIGESFKGKEELMQEYFCKICCGCAETNRETFRTAGIQNRAILNCTEIISNNLFLVDLRLYYTVNMQHKFLNCTTAAFDTHV